MITGGAPETGFRLVLERLRENETLPCTYRGRVELPEEAFNVVAEVAGDRTVIVHLNAPKGAACDALTEKIRLLVRQVVKDAEPSTPLSRKIVRWRGEK
jgi:hypothetical protein